MTEPSQPAGSGPVWRIEYDREAKRVLRRLPRALLKRIEATINALAYDPHPPGSRKLINYENLYRIRVAGWRIVYALKDDVLVILIVRVAPRGNVSQPMRMKNPPHR
jgi:mRNA interferase RelE/StbE